MKNKSLNFWLDFWARMETSLGHEKLENIRNIIIDGLQQAEAEGVDKGYVEARYGQEDNQRERGF